jgi:ABC-2 type transport system ATP-binding protein
MLLVSELCKTYPGGVQANDRLSLQVAAGEVVAILGPNGAGKTTLVEQIVGLRRPTSGSIVVAGVDVLAESGAGQRLCSYQPQGQVPLQGLSPREAIGIVARLRGASREQAAQRTQQIISALDIGAWADTPNYTASGGIGRLTSFAMALAQPAPLVILDEPTNDVDPLRREALWQQVHRAAQGGHAVLVVTHNVTEAEQACDRIVVIDHGRVLAQGRPRELLAADAGRAVRLELTFATPHTPTPLLPPALGHVHRDGALLRAALATEHHDLISAWASDLQTSGTVTGVALRRSALADVYRDHIATGPAELVA